MELSLEDSMFRIFIIGTTAVGKTKLSVALAQHLKAQIISCDSKQLYKYASIMTAKVTEEEAQGVPHHMIDCLGLEENAYNRNKYFKEASEALRQIEEKKKAAIVVGGTNYYIETLLFNLKKLTERDSSSDSESEQKQEEYYSNIDAKATAEQKKQLEKVRSLSKEQRYELLLKKDKVIALKTHRNDQKRILQFLQRIIVTQKPISKDYGQKIAELRNKNSLVFWVRNSDKEELLGMVTKRIYKMLDKQGLTQIFSIYYYIQIYNRIHKKQIEVKNIEQYSGAGSSIGVRQFKELYIEVRAALDDIFKQHQQKIVAKDEIDYHFIHSVIFDKFQLLKYTEQCLAKCREQLILDTKHYCKRQLTWIRNRMYTNQPHKREHFFVLELSQKEEDEKMEVMQRFEKQVARRALDIVDSIRAKGFGSVLQKQEEFTGQHNHEPLNEWKKYYCQACKQELNGLYTWTQHLESRRHQAQQKHYDKRQQRELYIQQQRKLAEERRLAKQKQKQANQGKKDEN